MNWNKKLINTLLALFAFVTTNAQENNNDAQAIDPVQWSYTIANNIDSVSVIQIKATMLEGYHIFTNNPGDEDGFLTPTTISVEFYDAKGSLVQMPVTDRVANKKAKTVNMEGIGKVNYFEKEVVYTMPFSAKPILRGASINISYQCCNESMCFPPAMLTLPIQ